VHPDGSGGHCDDRRARTLERRPQRRRFAKYVPPAMEKLGRAEVEHDPRNNRMRAI
jgi:hypothetical protein